jgi:hypothetical protein
VFDTCTKCGNPRDMPRTDQPGKFRCRKCHGDGAKFRYANNPLVRAAKEAYRQRNLEHCNAVIHRNALRRLYGITPEQLQAMKLAQDCKCAICGESPKRLCIDHDHATGKVRKLLCIQCNTALSYMEDTQWFQTATAYLTFHQNL